VPAAEDPLPRCPPSPRPLWRPDTVHPSPHDIALIAALDRRAAVADQLSDVDMLTAQPACVTATGPRRQPGAWLRAAAAPGLDGGDGDSATRAATAEAVSEAGCDASAPDAGPGCQPRRQRGGDSDVASLTAPLLAWAGVAPAVGAIQRSDAPDGGWAAARAGGRLLVAPFVGAVGAALADAATLAEAVGFAARMAAMEAAKGGQVLGRRRKAEVRGRHILAAPEDMRLLLAAAAIGHA